MGREFRDDPSFQPWGPFISDTYKNEPITKGDIIIASIVWGLTLVNVIVAVYLIYKQTRGSRSPLKSFAFYFTILFFWCIQVQLLLQIIINRIRIIVPDRRRSGMIMIATATFVTAINIIVFNIWIPSRLQINHRYYIINEYWDRLEKGLYLIVDAMLNWYFLKTVKANLISNGLTKYNKLVRFNQQIVVVSLLMDAMIIAAMSIPNSFVYIQFHPLAYLVKLNIEITMANLIKRIAISTSRKPGMESIAQEFKSSSNLSSTGQKTGRPNTHKSQRGSVHELASFVSYTGDAKASDRIASFAPTGNQIKEVREVVISHEPNPFYERRGWEVEITGGQQGKESHTAVEERGLERNSSLGSVIEGNESSKSAEFVKRGREESDDEAALVGQKEWGCPRRPS